MKNFCFSQKIFFGKKFLAKKKREKKKMSDTRITAVITRADDAKRASKTEEVRAVDAKKASKVEEVNFAHAKKEPKLEELTVLSAKSEVKAEAVKGIVAKSASAVEEVAAVKKVEIEASKKVAGSKFEGELNAELHASDENALNVETNKTDKARLDVDTRKVEDTTTLEPGKITVSKVETDTSIKLETKKEDSAKLNAESRKTLDGRLDIRVKKVDEPVLKSEDKPAKALKSEVEAVKVEALKTKDKVAIDRVQYSYTATPEQQVNILKKLAKKSVNIAAITTEGGNVTLVVGPSTSNDEKDNFILEKYLKRYLSTPAKKDVIVQLLKVQDVTGTPGAYYQFYKALVKAGVVIIKQYLGESFTIGVYFQVPKDQIELTKQVLTKVALSA